MYMYVKQCFVLCLQSRPTGIAAWFCEQCNALKHEQQRGHYYINHATKSEVLQCDVCLHQDVVIDDFIDHMYRIHAVQVTSGEQARSYLHSVPPFTRLSYCSTCGVRNSSNIVMRRHINSHRSSNPTTTAAPANVAPTASAPAVRPTPPPRMPTLRLPPPPGLRLNVPFSRMTTTMTTIDVTGMYDHYGQPMTVETARGMLAIEEPKADEELDDSADVIVEEEPQGAVGGVAVAGDTNKFPRIDTPTDSDDGDDNDNDNDANDDEDDVVSTSDVATLCLLADEQITKMMSSPTDDAFPHTLVAAVLYGTARTTDWRRPLQPRRLVFDGLVNPGFYRLDNEAYPDVYEMEVVIHDRHPRRWTSTLAAAEKNPEGKPLKALLLSTGVPATAVAVAYIDDSIPDAVWEGRWCGETRLAFNVEVTSVADDS